MCLGRNKRISLLKRTMMLILVVSVMLIGSLGEY